MKTIQSIPSKPTVPPALHTNVTSNSETKTLNSKELIQKFKGTKIPVFTYTYFV